MAAEPAASTELFAHFTEDAAPVDQTAFEPDEVARGLANVSDPQELLTQAQARRQELEQQLESGTDAIESRVEQKQVRLEDQTKNDPNACVPYPGEHAPPTATGTTVAELHAEIQAALARETGELDQSEEAARCDLEARFQVQLASVERTGGEETANVDQAVTENNQRIDQYASGERDLLHDSQRMRTNAAAVTAARHENRITAPIHEAASVQIEETTRVAQRQEAQIRGAATAEATAARTTGDAEAQRAIDAANARAATLTGPEADAVRAQGVARATQAHATAATRAAAIATRADTMVTQAWDRVNTANATMRQHETAQVTDLHTHYPRPSVEDRRAVTVRDIDRDAATADGGIAGQVSGVHGGGADRQRQHAARVAAARQRLIDQRDRALRELTRQHTERLSSAQRRARDAERRLDASHGHNLPALRRMVTGTMRSIDDQSVQANHSMQRQVDHADRRITTEARAQISRLHTRARQAIASLRALERHAEDCVRQIRRRGQRHMANDLRDGNAAMGRIAERTLRLTRHHAERAAAQLTTEGEALRAGVETSQAGVDAGVAALLTMEDSLQGDIRTEMMQNAVNSATQSLALPASGGVANADAVAAMDTLNSLPDDLQGRAVEQLNRDAYDRLISSVPETRRQEFESLYRNTHNPERKLLLWREFHASLVQNDMTRLADQELHDTTLTPAERQRRHDRSLEIARTTRSEATEEAQHLIDEANHGHAFTETDVVNLNTRKEHEHRIEQRYNINLVNDLETNTGSTTQANQPTDRRVWSDQELTDMESGLQRMPDEHLRSDALLHEIRRSGVARDWVNGAWQTSITGGDHLNGNIRIYDGGTGAPYIHPGETVPRADNYRHTGETDARSDHNAGQVSPRGPMNVIEENIVHELGHDVEDIIRASGSDAVDRFNTAAGWNTLDQAHLETALHGQGMNDAQVAAEIARLEATRANPFFNRNTTQRNGVTYQVDPYSGNFLQVNDNSMPMGTAVEQSHWGYAHSNQRDHFAEVYMMSVHTPTQLHADLVAAPRAALTQAETDRATAQTAFDNATTPAARTAAQTRLTQLTQLRDQAQATVTARQTQWDIMRHDVFHGDTAATDATTRLQAMATSPERQARLATFQTQVNEVVTPQQVELMRQHAQTEMEAMP